MLKPALAALGVALIAGGESFSFLGGVDILLFRNDGTLYQAVGLAGVGLSALFGAWVFVRVARQEATAR